MKQRLLTEFHYVPLTKIISDLNENFPDLNEIFDLNTSSCLHLNVETIEEIPICLDCYEVLR